MKKIIFLSIFIVNCLSAQIVSPINSSRSIDWTSAGVPGGIPNRTTVYATLNPGTYGNGSNDATTGIQAALNNCPANQVVFLAAGTYRINGSILIPSNVTLRGAGPQKTILKGYGSDQAIISLGPLTTPNEISNSVSITNGANSGSSNITLSNANGVTTGSYLIITELNDSGFISIAGGGGGNCAQGNCTWYDGGQGWNGTRVLGQTVEVTSVNGKNIGFSPALYMTYKSTLSPLATSYNAGAKYAGVEDLQVYADSTGYTTNFYMSACAYCWIKNVESNYADGDHAIAYYSYHCEIRDSYFHDAFIHSPGGTDADVDIASYSSGCLVENNQFWRLHVSLMLEWGAAGNVIAYNYSSGNFSGNSSDFLIPDFSMHGAHPMFNLYEGNVATSFNPDDIWGSSSDNTAFRNWFKGTTKICSPFYGRGTPDTAASSWACQANRAMAIDAWSRNYNLVGNAVGSKDLLQVTYYNNGINKIQMNPLIIARSVRSYDNTTYGFSFGYGGGGASDDGTCSGDTTLPYTSSFMHGNYNYADGAINWDPTNSDHTLPPSLYLTTKPSWFANTVWPLIGPDVSGYSNKNPAEVCFEKGSMPTCLSSITSIHNRLQSEAAVKIYPNPIQNKIYFDPTETITEVNISLYTIDGKILVKQNLNLQTERMMDVSNLVPGIYYLRITNNNFNSNQKIIITK